MAENLGGIKGQFGAVQLKYNQNSPQLNLIIIPGGRIGRSTN